MVKARRRLENVNCRFHYIRILLSLKNSHEPCHLSATDGIHKRIAIQGAEYHIEKAHDITVVKRTFLRRGCNPFRIVTNEDGRILILRETMVASTQKFVRRRWAD